MEPQKTPNIQSNPKKKRKKIKKHHDSRLQAILQSQQESMVLAQKQTHRSMEQNRKHRNGPITV